MKSGRVELGGAVVRRRPSAGRVGRGLWLLPLLSLFAACSGSSTGSGASCQAFCDDLCDTLAACPDVALQPGCAGECAANSRGDCSRSRPADQLTCSELEQVYECAHYCATLCERAPSCGSFDSGKCSEGCAAEGPPLCNAASVAARTCDQLKPELRLYQDVAEAERDGDHIVDGSSDARQYGLCREAADCELPLGCLARTNTCGPCQADADCEQGVSAYVCSAGQCSKVDCASDADCSGGRFCESTLHVCGNCHSNADCSEPRGVCSPATAECMQCVANGDCTVDLPHCDTSLTSLGGVCEPCKSDVDCADRPATPFCDFSCVECKGNADCTDAARPTCNPIDGKCESD